MLEESEKEGIEDRKILTSRRGSVGGQQACFLTTIGSIYLLWFTVNWRGENYGGVGPEKIRRTRIKVGQ